ncbi:MAG: energy-coupled thiamine transporter ThiT [Anaerofustis sp.]
MDLQTFFESITGQLLTVAGIILILVLIFLPGKKEQTSNLKAMALSSILIATAFVSNNILPHVHLPQGGSATMFSMFFLFLIGYLLGPKRGILAGMAFGLLNFLYGPSAYYPLQILMDYPLAFGMLGLGGFFRDMKHGLITGYLVSILGRFFVSFLSGAIFFAEYAPAGYNGWSWSFVYNITYIGLEGIVTVAVLMIPAVKHAILKLKQQY